MRTWGWVAAGWSVAFALLHLFWALGGVAVLLLVAGALAVSLARAAYRRLLFAGGGALGLALALHGLAVQALMPAGAYDGNAAISAEQRRWSLWLWNPWFVVGGLVFGLAALDYRRR